MTNPKPTKKPVAAPAMITTQEVGVLIEALRSDFRGVIEGQAHLREQVAILKEMVGKNTEDIALLKLEMRGVRAELSALRADVDQLKADVAQLKIDVAQLKVDVAELKQRSATAEDEMRVVKDDRAAIHNRLNDIERKMDSGFSRLEVQILSLEQRAAHPN